MRIYTKAANVSAITAIPPTTPPAMAPALLFEGEEVGTGGDADVDVDGDEGVVVVVEDGEEVVGNATEMSVYLFHIIRRLIYQEDLSCRRSLRCP
jgi:hypothetical protein